MQKLIRFIILLVFTGLRLNAQTTILDQELLTQGSFNTFTPVSVTGMQNWYFNAAYGAVCSGYSGGQSYENEDWLIGPIMNLFQVDDAKLSFDHTRGSAAVMNTGVAEGWYKAYATANYTGHPSTTQWTELQGINQNIPTAWQYVSSGGLVIPEVVKSHYSRIAFRYISSAEQSATWQIKNVKVTGVPPIAGPGSDNVFKITNWNTEWLGCTTEGPINENLQISNVVSLMLSMDSDIYCLQEVSNTVFSPTIATLVSLLGNQWGGVIAPSNTGDCNQRQGIIYKKSKVQFVSAFELNSGDAAQGNSYYYNWSNGRYPALYNVNLVTGGTLIPVSLVNIHGKSEDGNVMSHTRRKGASEALKTILDGPGYNIKKVIIIGDFNDYLIGTSNNACGCNISPYKNFIDDENHYTGITKHIIDVRTNWGIRPIIGNIIISDELAGNYVANSAMQETAVSQEIANYYTTTSNHLPVSATFQFSVLGTPDISYAKHSWTISPNPVKDKLHIIFSGVMNDTVAEIYDLTGRQIMREKLGKNTMDVSVFPAGVYILKIGDRSRKFVKK